MAQGGSGPDWWRTGVVYQIYPRSFADSNGDGLGDLAGIEARLDHLAGSPDSLGVDAIWLSPVYPSPDFDFGYDVADYVGVDPRFGSLEAFERLVEAAHRRGLRVILDLVLNHSSSQHPWFQASRASRTGPYADWYLWRDSPGRSVFGRRRPPNNWRSWFGGSAWTWDEAREQFYMHTFLAEQPDFNWRNPAVREALFDVVRTWLDRGVDGFRLDVFNVYFKDAMLRSNPPRIGFRGAWSWQRHLYDRNQPELFETLQELRSIIDAEPGRMTVGELFNGSFVDAAAFVAPGHLIFDWSIINQPFDARAMARAVAAREAVFGARWPTNVLSNHDQPRHASRFDDGVHGDARAKVAAALLLTLRGTAFLYYGEEIGLRNLRIPNARAFDPPARRASLLFPWWNRDQARGPMAWDGSPSGGFTTGAPWLPAAPDVAERNVARELADPDSVLSFYRRLLALRRESAALHDGGFQSVDAAERSPVFSYLRLPQGEAGRAFVALNFGSAAAQASLPPAAPDRSWLVGLSTHRAAGGPLANPLALAPFEAVIALER